MFNLFNFLAYIIVTAATPGPNNLMSMACAIKYGFKRSLPFNFGIGVGFSIVMLISTSLLTVLFPYIDRFKFPLIVLGAIYLLYLAYETYTSSVTLREGDKASASFLKGFILQFINPKIYIYALISMELYILPYFIDNKVALFLFSQLLAFVGFIFTVLWSLFGSFFRRLFLKHQKLTNSILALVLVYCAISLFF